MCCCNVLACVSNHLSIDRKIPDQLSPLPDLVQLVLESLSIHNNGIQCLLGQLQLTPQPTWQRLWIGLGPHASWKKSALPLIERLKVRPTCLTYVTARKIAQIASQYGELGGKAGDQVRLILLVGVSLIESEIRIPDTLSQPRRNGGNLLWRECRRHPTDLLLERIGHAIKRPLHRRSKFIQSSTRCFDLLVHG